MKSGLVLGGLSALLFEIPQPAVAETEMLPDPEPVQYLRACDVMGAGFIQLPQSDVCLKIGGYVSYEVSAGADVYTGERRKSWGQHTKAKLNADARSETELGSLNTFFEIETNFTDGTDEGASFSAATIELGGLLIGASDSQFDVWLGSAGNVSSDDVIPYVGGMTNQVSYTVRLGNGLSAMFGGEQGASADKSSSGGEVEDEEEGDGLDTPDMQDHLIDSYMPHLVGGLKLERHWGAIATVLGCDSVFQEIAAKVRLDLRLGGPLTAFVMAGYQSDPEKPNYYGAWDGTYAAWSGLSASLSPKLTLNSQVAYADSGTYALAFNADYEVVPGLIVTPELDYTAFGSRSATSGDAFAGVLSIQRNF